MTPSKSQICLELLYPEQLAHLSNSSQMNLSNTELINSVTNYPSNADVSDDKLAVTHSVLCELKSSFEQSRLGEKYQIYDSFFGVHRAYQNPRIQFAVGVLQTYNAWLIDAATPSLSHTELQTVAEALEVCLNYSIESEGNNHVNLN